MHWLNYPVSKILSRVCAAAAARAPSVAQIERTSHLRRPRDILRRTFVWIGRQITQHICRNWPAYSTGLIPTFPSSRKSSGSGIRCEKVAGINWSGNVFVVNIWQEYSRHRENSNPVIQEEIDSIGQTSNLNCWIVYWNNAGLFLRPYLQTADILMHTIKFLVLTIDLC